MSAPPPPKGLPPPPPKKSVPKPAAVDPFIEEQRQREAGGATAPQPAAAAPAPPTGIPPPPPSKAPPPPPSKGPPPAKTPPTPAAAVPAPAAAPAPPAGVPPPPPSKAPPPPPSKGPPPAKAPPTPAAATPPVAAAAAPAAPTGVPPPPPAKAPPPPSKAAPPVPTKTPTPAPAAAAPTPAAAPPTASSKIPPSAPPPTLAAKSPATTSPSAAASKTASKAPTAAEYRERVRRIYEAFCPSQLPRLDATMAQYAGREGRLIDALVEQYGSEPPHERLPDSVMVRPSASNSLAPSPARADPPQPSGVVSPPAPASPTGLSREERDQAALVDDAVRGLRGIMRDQAESYTHMYYLHHGALERMRERRALHVLHRQSDERQSFVAREVAERGLQCRAEEAAYLQAILLPHQQQWSALCIAAAHSESAKQARHEVDGALRRLAEQFSDLQTDTRRETERLLAEIRRTVSSDMKDHDESSRVATKTLLETAVGRLSDAADAQVERIQRKIADLDGRVEEQLAAMVALQEQQQERLGLNKSAVQREIELEERERQRSFQALERVRVAERTAEKDRTRALVAAKHFEELARARVAAAADEEVNMRYFIEDTERAVRRSLVHLMLQVQEGVAAADLVARRREASAPRAATSGAERERSSARGGDSDEACVAVVCPPRVLYAQAGGVGRYLQDILDYASEEVCARLGLWLAAAGYGSALGSSSSPRRQAAMAAASAGLGPAEVAAEGTEHAEARYLRQQIASHAWETLHEALVDMSRAEMQRGFSVTSPDDGDGALPFVVVPALSIGEARVLVQKVSRAQTLLIMLEEHQRSAAVAERTHREEERRRVEQDERAMQAAPRSPSPSPKPIGSAGWDEQQTNARVYAGSSPAAVIPPAAVVTVPRLDAFTGAMTEKFRASDEQLFRAWERCRSSTEAADGDLAAGRWHDAWRAAWRQDLGDQTNFFARLSSMRADISRGVSMIDNAAMWADPLEEALALRARLDRAGDVLACSEPALAHGHRLNLLAAMISAGRSSFGPPAALLPLPSSGLLSGKAAYSRSAALVSVPTSRGSSEQDSSRGRGEWHYRSHGPSISGSPRPYPPRGLPF